MDGITTIRTNGTGAAIITARVHGDSVEFFWMGAGSAVRMLMGDALVAFPQLAGWQAADLAEAKAQVAEVISDACPRCP